MTGNSKNLEFIMKQNYQELITEDLDHILDHTKDILEEFRDSRIFVTGGTGFFGTWLLETFARANQTLDLKADLTILSRHPGNFRKKHPHLAAHKHFSFITGDVRDFSFPEGVFNYVFHLATEASDELNRNEPLKMFDVIVEGTRHVLDFAISAGVQNFLLASSGAVYGRQPYDMLHISEDYRGGPETSDPLSSYGEGKRVAELLGSIYSGNSGLKVKIARCFTFIGPYLPLDKHFAIGNFILNGIRNQPIFIKGDGSPLRSYLYAADLVIWLLTILARGKTCYPYNVGSEEAVSIAGLAALISASFTPPAPVKTNPDAEKASDIERYVPSCQRAMSDLGLEQYVTLHEGIRRTIRFHKEYWENDKIK